MSLVIDTSVLVGAARQSDPDHAICFELLADTQEQRVIPSPVLVETAYHLRDTPSWDALLADLVAGGFRTEDLHIDDYGRVRDLMRQYGDLRPGFVDCAVLAVVERLKETKLATLDRRDFTVMRPLHVASLELLPSL